MFNAGARPTILIKSVDGWVDKDRNLDGFSELSLA